MITSLPLGTYEENTTGLRVNVVLVQRFKKGRYSSGETYETLVEQEFRTEAGQPCFDDEHTDLAKSGPPRILRCPTNNPNVKSPLYLIRQR